LRSNSFALSRYKNRQKTDCLRIEEMPKIARVKMPDGRIGRLLGGVLAADQAAAIGRALGISAAEDRPAAQ
jgi:hypothetical protein